MIIGSPHRDSSAEPPTVADILGYPALKRGDPVVVAGARGLGRPVRWVHVSEVLGIAGLLHGGEMLLTTGMVLPESPAAISSYVDGLAEAGVAALVIGLGPRFVEPLPESMVAAAERRGLPLIALRRTIAFIDVTEEVHAALVDVQVRELRASESIHTIFSSLVVQGAEVSEVLRQVVRLSGAAVVLENLAHQVLALDPGARTKGDVLAEWAEHTQRPVRNLRTQYDPQTGWLQTIVGARGSDWGRLILMDPDAGSRDVRTGADSTATVPRSLIMLIERAASTLAIGRLVDRESELLDLNTQQSVLSALLAGVSDESELDQQAAALGVSLRRMPLAALAVRHREDPEVGVRQHAVHALSGHVAEAVRSSRAAALVAPVDEFTVGALIQLTGTNPRSVAEAVAESLTRLGMLVTVAYAGTGSGVDAARTSLAESLETVSAAAGIGTTADVVGWDDLGIRGVLFSLRNDPRLARFAERTLGPLLRHDAAHDTELVSLLRHYLAAGRNKTLAAQHAFVSRQWMHERLGLIGTILKADLENEETYMNLQMALVIADSVGHDATHHRRVSNTGPSGSEASA